jgi:signal transduction histidine kinase
LILLGLVLALFAAWLGGRLFIRRPIDGLLQAATEWSNGNYDARTQIKDPGSEIGRLGSAFNKMAAAVSARYAAQKRAEEELRQLNMTLEERVAQRTTELANANRELAAARDQAESANAAKTAFLAAMSHELRTPLNAIVGFSELITQEVFGPVQKKYIECSESILSAGQRMSTVVGDVLTIAQLEAGTFELEWDDLELSGMVREAVEKLQRAHPARSADISFASTVDHLVVRADLRSVEQMIAKLLSNAVKFSEAGTPIRLSLGVEKDGAARLSISDHGIGMTEAEAEAAVHPFRQVDGRMARKYEGSGLGLSIVNKLIENHHGWLEIVSAPGEGTEVSLFFPSRAQASERMPRLVAA